MSHGVSRRKLLVIAGIATCAAFAPALAQADEPAIYTGIVAGVALGGHDAVAYFTDGAPVEGSGMHSVQWQGVEWRFATAANRDRFQADPQAFAPQYGGYCAWAVAEGYTAHGDPHHWRVVDGRLYLNYSAGIQRRWERDIPGYISRADTNWPGVLSK